MFSVAKGDDDTLVGNQMNATASPSWSDVTYYVPGPTSTAHQTGFANSNDTVDDDLSTSGFIFYGQVVLKQVDGNLTTLWYAAPTDTDGIWSLNWNETGDTSSGHVPVALKTRPPTEPMVDEDEDDSNDSEE